VRSEAVEIIAKNYNALWSVTDIESDLEARGYTEEYSRQLSREVYKKIHEDLATD
jgi:sulfur transfer complex TusBCD TusB component (DsrH family)